VRRNCHGIFSGPLSPRSANYATEGFRTQKPLKYA
jgi:hypothetical protein